MNILKRWLKPTLSTLDSLDAYQLWAQSYPAQAHNAFMQAEQTGMLDLLPSLSEKVVLDLACGTGRYGKIAIERGAKQVIGSDNSPAMLKCAVIDPVALAITEAIPLPTNSVDIVLCGLALGHLPQIEKTIVEISRILTADGIALISDLHPYQTLTGAQRTFKTPDGTDYAVEHHLHHISDYISVGQAHQLTVTTLSEIPVIGEVPAVLIIKYQKKCD